VYRIITVNIIPLSPHFDLERLMQT